MSHSSGLAENFRSKIVPTDISTAVCGVVNTVFIRFNHIYKEPGQIEGVGRCADLVVYNERVS